MTTFHPADVAAVMAKNAPWMLSLAQALQPVVAEAIKATQITKETSRAGTK